MSNPAWTQKMTMEALEEAKRRAKKDRVEFARFRADPVGFGEEILGDTYTDDVKALMRSVAANPITVARSANAVGKCVAYGETILDADGVPHLAEELIGTAFPVWSIDPVSPVWNWKPKASIALATDNGVQSVVEIVTESGRRIVRTTNHPMVVGKLLPISKHDIHREVKNNQWLDAGEIEPGDCILGVETFPTRQQTNRIPDAHVRILAYVIGDGSCSPSSVWFTQEDGEVLDEFREDIEAMGCKLKPHGKYTYRVSSPVRGNHYKEGNPVCAVIRRYGLWDKNSYEKFIPRPIFSLPKDQIAMFLSRLYATDGWISFQDNGKKGVGIEIGYTSVSRKLCEDIQWLLMRFGVTASLRKKKTVCCYKGEKKRGIAYSVEIRDAKSAIRFAEQVGVFGKKVESLRKIVEICRKKDKLHKWHSRGVADGFRWEKVISVEKLGYVPTVMITVPGNETFLTAFVEHNSHCAARIALWWYETFPDSQVYVTAAPPLENLKNILWGEIQSVVQGHAEIFTNERTGTLVISRSPRSFVTGVAIPTTGTSEERQAKFSGKHAPYLLFIVDEGDAVPEEVYKGIEGCMSGGNARLLIMFNPKMSRGPVYDLEHTGRGKVVHLSAFRHPNVIEGRDVIPGAVTRETVVRRINEWTRPLIEGETPGEIEKFEVPDFLVGTVAHSLSGNPYPPLPAGERVVEEPGFYYMVLGIYPAQGANQLISSEWVDRARSRYDQWVAERGEKPPADIRPRMGLDVAEYGPDWNVPFLRYGSFVARVPKIWQGVDPMQTADKAYQLCERYGVDIVLVDATGVGSGVAPAISRKKRGLRAVSIKVAGKPGNFLRIEQGEFYALRDQLWWALREWLRTDPAAMLPPEPLLVQELLVPTYEVVGKTVRVMDKNTMREYLKRSPNFADALALTFCPAERARVVRLEG